MSQRNSPGTYWSTVCARQVFVCSGNVPGQAPDAGGNVHEVEPCAVDVGHWFRHRPPHVRTRARVGRLARHITTAYKHLPRAYCGPVCTWRVSLRHGDAPKGSRSMYNVGSNVCASHSLAPPPLKISKHASKKIRRLSRTARKREVVRTWPTRRRRARARLMRTARAREVARTWPSYEMVRDTVTVH